MVICSCVSASPPTKELQACSPQTHHYHADQMCHTWTEGTMQLFCTHKATIVNTAQNKHTDIYTSQHIIASAHLMCCRCSLAAERMCVHEIQSLTDQCSTHYLHTDTHTHARTDGRTHGRTHARTHQHTQCLHCFIISYTVPTKINVLPVNAIIVSTTEV